MPDNGDKQIGKSGGKIIPFPINFRAGSSEMVAAMNGRAARPPFLSWETGLAELDYALGGGLHPGELTVVGARTGKGKSSFVDQLALTLSRAIPTTYFSYEMRYNRTIERMVSKITNIPALAVRIMLSKPPPMDVRISAAIDQLMYGRTLRVAQSDHEIPSDLNTAFVQLIEDQSRLAIFDALEDLDDWDSVAGQRADYAPRDVLRRITQFAQEGQIHVISVHQLQRPTGTRARKPDEGDLADSFHVAKKADNVIMIHRPFGDDPALDNVAELIIRKNRNGPTCTIHVEWYGKTMSYRDMLPSEQERLTCCKRKS
jgi:replicative DNA helicase